MSQSQQYVWPCSKASFWAVLAVGYAVAAFAALSMIPALSIFQHH